jgi:ACT domain-containing protein
MESKIFHVEKVCEESFLLKKIVVVLEELRGQKAIAEICREHGISQVQYYKWRDKCWCKVCT